MSATATTTLYDRLGGAGKIDDLIDRIVDLHLANPAVATRFEHADQARARAYGKLFFKAGTGGPEPYDGRTMPEAHAGMNINAAEFMAVVDDILQALDEFGHDQSVRDEVLGIAWSLKGEIIGA